MGLWDKLKGVGSAILHGGGRGGAPSLGGGAPGGAPMPGITDPYFRGIETGPSYGGPTAGMPGVNLQRTAGGTQPQGNWVSRNLPTLVTAAGVGASIYGAHKGGQAEDADRAQRSHEWDQQYGLNERNTSLNEKEFQSKLDMDVAEKQRRQRVLMQVLAMGRQDSTMPPPAAGG